MKENVYLGDYRLSADNHPEIYSAELLYGSWPSPAHLKEWGEPHWEIYHLHDGSVEIHANRPTTREVKDGDLHGNTFGSVITLESVNRLSIRNGLRLARKLCKCSPQGIIVDDRELDGIDTVTSNIRVVTTNGCELPFE